MITTSLTQDVLAAIFFLEISSRVSKKLKESCVFYKAGIPSGKVENHEKNIINSFETNPDAYLFCKCNQQLQLT